ncbi:aspartate dehydrogenase [Paraburkholderia sp. Ac-20340]|uniref:aspartate dehydrogenase n=1 Tax=Paraburkholderia sp. Ac-20340 TaxID=2703888 RepID=UPI001981B23C|nr:aspartate dehydrogenase [Paraburkholderia sp. Ac-20340]MBN3854004.1 aspartate dehydrogenase [Paraburkholderia sp. Ac-20340]
MNSSTVLDVAHSEASSTVISASSQQRIAIIGMGAMGRRVVSSLRAGPFNGLAIAGLDPYADAQALKAGLGVDLFANLDDLMAWKPTVVVECAGHAAVEGVVAQCLERGVDAIVASVGALSSDELRTRLHDAQEVGGSELTVVSGAIGGLDALSAARGSGIESVKYIGRKPPRAWSGTPADGEFDLDAIDKPTVIFEGTAAESARQYPKNANVTAAVAIAGIGFEKTHVTMMADPTVNKNVHEVEAKGPFGQLNIRLENNPLPDNPKTSWLAALSIEDAILRRLQHVI